MARPPSLGRHREPARRRDELGPFVALVTAFRWATVVIGLIIAGQTGRETREIAAGVVLLVYALVRTIRPLRYRDGSMADLLVVLGEVAVQVLVVVATGYWNSPYVFVLATAIIAAGFARGFGFAFRTAVTAIAAIALPFHLQSNGPVQLTLQWGAELLMVALLAGYARRLFGEAEERASLALSQMSALSEANDLLVQLTRVAQTLPASLDLEETVTSAASQFRHLLAGDVVSVLLRDESSGDWDVAVAQGVRLPPRLTPGELPPAVRRALDSGQAQAAASAPGEGVGFAALSQSALVAPLVTRGSVVGGVVVESRRPRAVSQHEIDVARGLAGQAAVAIDNARWFARLRTVGADEERTRIARDLHDRVGQSLAYLAFELDRIRERAAGTEVEPDLEQLRRDVRRVVSEVRETLYDLRTDVSDERDLTATLDSFLQRVGERSGLEVVYRHQATRRLPVPQERELWRIAQEAVTNAERHARAGRVTVAWATGATGAILEVADDGVGFEPGRGGRLDSYGIKGMRERADAIGALLQVESSPGRGTVVRCSLAPEEVDHP